MAGAVAVQTSFAELGTPLYEVTFVVLDLETTGTSPAVDRITEVGAVKVSGGEVLGELHSLVAPGVAIPAGVQALTGITEGMLRDCPPIEVVLPSLLEFLRGSTLVAHNARFDVSFLNAALERHAYPRLDLPVVDTARLARRALRDEVPNVRLATLAAHLRSRFLPTHRALADARATVDVLHGLLERVGPLGVVTLEDLRDYASSRSDPAFRKVGLVASAPEEPGVYRFLDARGEVLYVGRTRRLRDRLRRYFGQDPRRKVADLVRETVEVTWRVCPTELEAAVVEVREIVHHRPRYNRRGRNPERAVWVKLTRERFPRLSIVPSVRDPEALHVGPLPSKQAGERFVDAVHDALPLRRCTLRLSRSPHPPCVLKELGRCGAPCDGSQDEESYGEVVERYRQALTADPARLLAALRSRMVEQAARGRFEAATRVRSHLHHLAGVLEAQRRLVAILSVVELRAMRATSSWVEVVVVRRGRLAGSARLPAGATRTEAARSAAALAERPAPSPAGGPPTRGEAEEVALVLAWLDQPRVEVLSVDGCYVEPAGGGRLLHELRQEYRRVASATRRDRETSERAKVASRPPQTGASPLAVRSAAG